jgi:hypothetical protein
MRSSLLAPPAAPSARRSPLPAAPCDGCGGATVGVDTIAAGVEWDSAFHGVHDDGALRLRGARGGWSASALMTCDARAFTVRGEVPNPARKSSSSE